MRATAKKLSPQSYTPKFPAASGSAYERNVFYGFVNDVFVCMLLFFCAKKKQQKMNLDCFGAGHDQQTQSTRNLLDAFDGLGCVRPIGLLVHQLHTGF